MKKQGQRKNYVAKELKELRNGKSSRKYLNPYISQAEELIRAGLLYTLEDFAEKFPAIFPDPTLPLILDVGCYLGATVIELAKFNKGINILGIDLKYKRVVKSCHKIRKEGFKNCKIAICHAGELVSILPEDSFLGAFIFFPDPWEKERQQKHRLLTRHFFAEVYTKLNREGFIWLKTDNKAYFDEVLENIKKSPFVITDLLPGRIAVREYRTLFEEMFIRQGKHYYQVKIRKADAP